MFFVQVGQYVQEGGFDEKKNADGSLNSCGIGGTGICRMVCYVYVFWNRACVSIH